MIESESKFTYASLFSGIGGFEFGLNAVGGECVFASEIDKFAVQSYTTIHGEEPHGDITKIDAKDIPYHDVLVGGFPCQSFSVAGNRKGLEDSRGTLFFDIARIAKEVKPKVLLLENVKGLVNHDKGNTLDIMISTLNEIGYVVDFNVLNSKYFGVPQSRERIFIVAVREDLVAPEAFSEEVLKGNTIVPKRKRGVGEWATVFNFDFPKQLEVNIKLNDVLEDVVDDKYYLSKDKTDALLIQMDVLDSIDKEVDEINQVGNLKEGLYNRKNPEVGRVYGAGGMCPTINTMGGGSREPKVIRPVLTPHRTDKRQNGRRFKDDGEPFYTLTGQDVHGVVIGKPLKVREATKKGFAEAYPGDSVNYQFPNSKTRRGRVGSQIANTLEASNSEVGVVTPEYEIRKVTPLECWRLQGFPDESFFKAKEAGVSDSQLYRQSGNAVTVPVIESIGRKILEMDLF